MLLNYIKTALRNIRRHRGYSFINICGFAIGIAASIIIYLYIHKEISYDTFHARAAAIHRVLLIDKSLGVTNNLAGIVWPTLGPALKDELPEVVEAVRIWYRGRVPIDVDNQRIYAHDFSFADPEIFDMFDFSLVMGDEKSAIVEPNTAVITHEMAERLFGEADPVGRTFEVNDALIKVTGLFADIPENSHIRFDVLVSINVSDTTSGLGANLRSWNWISFPTYIQLADPAQEIDLDRKMIEVIRNHGITENFSVTHQPLKDVHLRSKNILFDRHNQNKGEIDYIYSLTAIAIFIILIASFNFMNLATARSFNRAREVGMRKVVGAKRQQLIRQFLNESFVLCMTGFIIALLIVILLARYLNSTYNLNLDLSLLTRIPILVSLLCGTALISLLAGSYPAFVLSSFRPAVVLRGTFQKTGYGVTLRKALVVLQFAVSIALIIGSGVVYQQMRYIQSKNIGYDRQQVMNIALTQDIAGSFEALVQRLSQSPGILSWSSSNNIPGRTMSRTGIQPEGTPDDENWIVSFFTMDDHFIETLGMSIVKGRNFSREFGTDTAGAVIINEAAVRALAWEEPLDRTFDDGNLRVIGVVRDFHFVSLRHKIEPVVIFFNPGANSVLSLKLKAGAVNEAIEYVREVWKEMFPHYPLEYTFLDEEFEQLHRQEANFGSLTRGFTTFAIVVACLGLFGLASFTAEQRTKEIGIRKVLGATVPGIVLLLSREFIILVALANIIAWPVGYYVMRGWLQNYAYRTGMPLGIFVFAGILAIVIAICTISYQSVSAARKNPVTSLQYE